MFQYILLDMDGTLTDSMEGITRCVQYALEAAGRPEPDRKKLLPFIGPPLRSQFAAWCGYDREKETDKIEFCVSKYRERFREVGWLENRVYPGMPKLLARLKAAGKTLAVATSKPIEFTEKILEYFELTPYFDVIVGASMDEGRETKYDVIREVLRRLAAGEEEKARMVMVGDRFHDVEAAKKAGLASIGVTFGYGSREELLSYRADRIVDTVEELGEVLLTEE
ncbi:MAG: HAD hydrolase-like protein [Lachnospiraceae bacterium]|nr:HAD hydrolase-like protein [Lachnospiraceae bacterium]